MPSRRVRLVIAAWVTVLGANLLYCHQAGTSPLELFQNGVEWVRSHPLGPLVFVVAFCARPLLLFPASLLSVAAGYCFGIWWGSLWAHLAATLAAGLGYSLGRWLGLSRSLGKRGDQAVDLIRRYGLTSVVLMRWVFLPYDLVSYLGGAMRLPLGGFLLGSFLGNLPGTTSCILFGASIEGPLRAGGGVPINWRLQVISGLLFLATFLMGRWLRGRISPSRNGGSQPTASE